ncbi:MAG: LysM peptidoglycan-binding domain-containing protein, partial [Prevotella sp.]|nr:LysM peptidoglycan-binding domain-containing protein [Prevotella sp.]
RFYEHERKVDSLKQLMMVTDTSYEEAVRVAKMIVDAETKRLDAQLANGEQNRNEQEVRRLEEERREDAQRMNKIANKAALAREQLARGEEIRKGKEQEQQVLKKDVQRADNSANKATSSNELEGYNSDSRVRMGAYAITGIEHMVTVQPGQTLASISKAYLGPGMECYVEAVNGGIKSVQPGQKLKIPSVKIKKRHTR